MRPLRPSPAAIDSVDETEQQFYEALQQADLDRVMNLWSDDDEVFCVRPDGGRTVGHAAIRSMFETMFAHGTVVVQVDNVRRVHAHDIAVHNVVEHLRAASAAGASPVCALATNVYVRSGLGWRLVAHHASASGAPERHEADAEPPSVLH